MNADGISKTKTFKNENFARAIDDFVNNTLYKFIYYISHVRKDKQQIIQIIQFFSKYLTGILNAPISMVFNIPFNTHKYLAVSELFIILLTYKLLSIKTPLTETKVPLP